MNAGTGIKKTLIAAAFVSASLGQVVSVDGSMGGSAFADDTHGHIGDAVNELPIFDAHIHYKQPAWGPYPPEAIIQLMDENGIAMGLVSSTPDEGTIMLWEAAPGRIVPELRPYYEGAGSSNWTKADGMYGYIKGRLERYPHTGIGEFHLNRLDSADDELLRKIAALAHERDLYIHVHSGKGPVVRLFTLEPDLKIIWAHAGMSEPAEIVGEMMARYDRLYADTSFREYDILERDGSIDPVWRRVLEKYSDRFMVGSDTWVNGQWDRYEEIITVNRQWLAQFSRPIAEQIAYKNAERLFDRSINMDLIGTK